MSEPAEPASPDEPAGVAPEGALPGAGELVLASGSPRRRELLAHAGVEFEVRAAHIAEAILPGEAPADLCVRLAREKALAVADAPEPGSVRWILGADTVVVRDDAVLGKPRDAEHALAMLRSLVGRAHDVWTGVALVTRAGRSVRAFASRSRVRMRPAGDAELRRYVAGGEPMDKAGAYAIQGEGGRFVAGCEGSGSNVIGLPLEETLALLRQGVAEDRE